MSDVESSVAFFTAGAGEFAKVPSAVRPFVFQVCARQMILSAATAAETVRDAAALTAVVADVAVSRLFYAVAASIAGLSAKHSAEFLSATPVVIAVLEKQSTSFSGGLPPSGSGSEAGGSPPSNVQLSR